MKMIKIDDKEIQQEINTENYLEKKKNIKRESMEETDIIICQKKRKTKIKRISKTVVRLRSFSPVINIFDGFNSVCNDLVMHY